jgi:hypothetical protein
VRNRDRVLSFERMSFFAEVETVLGYDEFAEPWKSCVVNCKVGTGDHSTPTNSTLGFNPNLDLFNSDTFNSDTYNF